MAAVNIIGNILFPREYSIGGVSIDTVLSYDHVSEVQISLNPVETGLAVTDNIVAQPFRVVVEGVITLSSSAFGLVDYGIQGPIRDLAGGVAGAFGFDGFGSKVNQAWEELLTLQRSGVRVTLATG